MPKEAKPLSSLIPPIKNVLHHGSGGKKETAWKAESDTEHARSKEKVMQDDGEKKEYRNEETTTNKDTTPMLVFTACQTEPLGAEGHNFMKCSPFTSRARIGHTSKTAYDILNDVCSNITDQ